jgi:AraC-like DNA-binding protein
MIEKSAIVINEGYPGINPVQFGCQSCPSGHFFGPAVRPHWLLHYVVSGKGVFVRDGVTHRIEKSELFVIRPFEETYYEADVNDPWSYIWVGFTGDGLLDNVFDKPVISIPGAGKIFQDMRRCFELENGRSAFLTSRIWELVARIQDLGSVKTGHIDKALSFMHSEYANGITVGTVARHLSLDRTYFSTLFKSETGVSPVDYLTDLKLSKAAELMSVYGRSPTTAALSVGYPDYCHFSRAFKKRFGVSPRAYREQSEGKG